MAEYYIGQKFIGIYPPEAAEWCMKNDAYIKELIHTNSERQFEICAQEHPEPTHDEIARKREEYRKEHIDSKTLERQRKQANGTWTEENEAEYLQLDAEVTAWIEKNLPYPDTEK